MPIIRGRHSFDSHFTQIPNAWLRDTRLSYKARGLLAELLSHSIGFVVSRERLAALGKDGRDSITSAIKELEAVGYLTRKQTRYPNGQLAETIWTTRDPEVQPSEENPSAVQPSAVNPHLKNTNTKKTNKKNNVRLNAEEFESFWILYPRKVGKAAARKSLEKALTDAADSKALFAEILDGAKRLSTDPNLPPSQFIPYPATWIAREGWSDEPYPLREKTPEELAEIARLKSAEERARNLEIQERERKEAEEHRRHLEANPVERCEHGRVKVICPTCSPIKKSTT